MSQIHRDDDARACGAKTIVIGQSTVFVNGKLAAVDGDINTHSDGGLIPDTPEKKVWIEGKLVIVNKPDIAEVDGLGHEGAADETAEGSPNVFAYDE